MELRNKFFDRAYELFNSCGEKASKVDLYRLLFSFSILREDEQCDLMDCIVEENSEIREV